MKKGDNEMKIYYYPDVEEFISSLDKQEKAKTFKIIDLLQKFGSALSLPHSKKIERDLYELRSYGNRNIRIIYTFSGESVVLLHSLYKEITTYFKKRFKYSS